MIAKLDAGQTIADAVATLYWLRKNPRVAGKVGAVGFCWGGGLVNRIAVAAGDKLDAGVVFYGPSPAPAEAAGVKAPMMFHYAGIDDRVNATAPGWRSEELTSELQSLMRISYAVFCLKKKNARNQNYT